MKASLVCPSCGVTNPPGSLRCDCGHLLKSDPARATNRNTEAQRLPVLGILGVICFSVGIYFLLDPTVWTSSTSKTSETTSVVNLQALGIGETLSVVGAIFIAAEWRPRQ